MAFDAVEFAAEEAARALLRDGQDLESTAAGQLEEQLVRGPDQLRLRCLLVGCYHRGQRGGKGAAARLNAHLGWLIDHRPQHPMLRWPVYPHCSNDWTGWEANCRRWERQLAVARPSLAVFKRAAFFFLMDPSDREREVVEQAIRVHPAIAWGYARRGSLLLCDARHHDSTEGSRELAREALVQLDLAAARGDDDDRDMLLEDRAEAAYRAGNTETAEALAMDLLQEAEKHFEPGQRRYDAHRRLGHLALDRGDSEGALRQIAKAGVAWTGPRWVTGPDFSLAQTMLERGHRDAVASHLRDLRSRWTAGWDRIDFWLASIEWGETPDLTVRRR